MAAWLFAEAMPSTYRPLSAAGPLPLVQPPTGCQDRGIVLLQQPCASYVAAHPEEQQQPAVRGLG